MFVPTTEYYDLINNSNKYIIPKTDEVMLEDGTYKWVEDLSKGDRLNTGESVDHFEDIGKEVVLYVI